MSGRWGEFWACGVLGPSAVAEFQAFGVSGFQGLRPLQSFRPSAFQGFMAFNVSGFHGLRPLEGFRACGRCIVSELGNPKNSETL